MANEDVQYETRTVRAMRGMESRTIAKWEGEGWEFVSQSQGKLRTEIALRRPKGKSNAKLLIIGGAAFAVALIVIITIGTVSERGATEAAPTPSTSPSATATTPVRSPSPTPTPEETAEEAVQPSVPADVVITAENNAQFASLLTVSDYCDPSVAAFASQHKGKTVAFDGYIGSMGPHGDANTRYDILIIAGNFNESAAGPSFQFQDVNTTYDLHYTGDVPDSIGVGTNLRLTAEVLGYNEGGCQLFLEPVATAFR